MNIQRFLRSVLSVFVCCCVLFSTSVCVLAADTITITKDDIDTTTGIKPDDYPLMVLDVDLQHPTSFLQTGSAYAAASSPSAVTEWNWIDFWMDSVPVNIYTEYQIILQNRLRAKDNIQKGTYDVSCSVYIDDYIATTMQRDDVYLTLYDSNGWVVADHIPVDDYKWESLGNQCGYFHYGFNDVTLTGDAQLLRINFGIYTKRAGDLHCYVNEWHFVDVDQTEGLLSGILDGITKLPQNIADKVSGFFGNVVNAVVNLGSTILDGIKGLFVPSEEDITGMKDKWDSLLSDRFGALYQAFDIIKDYCAAFTEQEKKTIEIPSVTLNLAGADFVFGGWQVPIVPDGFEFLFEALKMITSIIATFAFVNALKYRFDKTMEGRE